MRLMPVLAATLLAVTSVAAAERDAEFAPWLGFRSGASLDSTTAGVASAEADAAWSLGLSAGWKVRPDGWLEVLFDHQTLEFDQGSGADARRFDVEVDYLQVGGGYEPPRAGTRPYVTAGLGLAWFGSDPGSVSDSMGLSGSIGGGFKVPIGRKALFRLEARAWAVLTSGTLAVDCGPGCRFSLGGEGFWQVGLRAAVAFRPWASR